MYPDNMVQLAVRMYLYRWNDRLQEDTATAAPYEACFLLINVNFSHATSSALLARNVDISGRYLISVMRF